MRVLFLDTNYPAFLDAEYKDGTLARKGYDGQMRYLIGRRFGTSDYYSHNLHALGHDAKDVIANCAPLQQAWWREHEGRRLPKPSLEAIVEKQVQDAAPDVLYVQEMNWPSRQLLERLRPHVGRIIGQTAYPLLPGLDCGPYDLVVTSFPHYVRLFQLLGVEAAYVPLAFEPRVLQEASPLQPSADVAFVGSYSHDHSPATALLDLVAAQTPAKFWGPSVAALPPESPVRRAYQGPAWGLDMFRVLGGSKIALNRHIAVAGPYANNMRLYEATGMGALLLTDEKANLPELFEPGRECVTYRDAADCVAQLRWLLEDEPERRRIAKAGQQRTLRDHTYARRMAQLAAVLQDRLDRPAVAPGRSIPVEAYGSRLARLARAATPLVQRLPTGLRSTLAKTYRRLTTPADRAVSGGYVPADQATASRLSLAWQAPSIAHAQDDVVRDELVRMYRGLTPRLFAALAEAIRKTGLTAPSVIEVGCASAYYGEVLRHLLGRVDYVGLDYSLPLLEVARRERPEVAAAAADANRLPLPDAACDILVSGCVLLHLDHWRDAIVESARVSKEWVILHRTPVVPGGGTSRFLKQAYGVDVAEWAFGEADLVAALESAGLKATWSVDLHEVRLPGVEKTVIVRTLLCRKRSARPL